ncbi:MAG: hypothetical protein Q7J20_02695 [Candidatus Nitrotoga sp.]|nr:hypothetical protein [Candidatus Nitrotoga sp.]MDP3498183.1 hypothetical protein [Candidatus Nitrotoga sp.]
MVEYRLLLSLSVENLVKGILVAHRIRHGDREPTKGLFSHKLRSLAANIPSSAIQFDNAENLILEDLTRYIEWAGRYPFPRNPIDYSWRGHSNTEHDAEIHLWKRLYSHLKDIGWVSKGNPNEDGWFFLLTRGAPDA